MPSQSLSPCQVMSDKLRRGIENSKNIVLSSKPYTRERIYLGSTTADQRNLNLNPSVETKNSQALEAKI